MDLFVFQFLFEGIGLIIIIFLTIHMIPVWIYLIGVIFSVRKYRNTYYIVTDHAVYVSGGIFAIHLQNKTFAELARVDIHRGIFDQIFNVGDIKLTSNQFKGDNSPACIGIDCVSNYSELFQLINKLQKDIYADVMYPNDLRPKENQGYNTVYCG